MPVGVVRFVTAGVTIRFGSSITGFGTWATTGVSAVAVLLLGSGSGSVAATVAVLLSTSVICCGSTTMITATPSDAARFPMSQTMVVVPLQGMGIPPGKLNVALLRVTPVGRVSVTWTFVAPSGPWLMTFIPQVRFFRTVAGLGTVVLVIDRSAEGEPLAEAACADKVIATAKSHCVLAFMFTPPFVVSFTPAQSFHLRERNRSLRIDPINSPPSR